MKSFLNFLKEETEADSKLKHIHHAEDRPLLHGAEGFEHARDALNQAHEHVKGGNHSSHLTMKYDGSPAVVFGHHPENGKFFVASKSAFNKTPKLNYTHKDIEKNHGHAPGLMDKLHASLNHLKKIAPKTGVYQGDLMYTHDDLKHGKQGKVSFTPNTITYTGKGEEANKIKNSKMGIVVHQQYHGKTLDTLAADPHPDLHNFTQHPDVWTKSAEHDTRHVHYSQDDQDEFKKHIDAAQKIHDEHKDKMYKATEHHRGDAGALATYINHTVRTDEVPSSEGFKKHIENRFTKDAQSKVKKLKTPAAQSRAETTSKASIKQHNSHIDANKDHYDNLLAMHHHLQQAKNVLVSTLNQHEGGLEHHIDGKRTGPEGFVINHAGQPTKLVDRKEFAKSNLLKVRK
jgi:hypothetical protein